MLLTSPYRLSTVIILPIHHRQPSAAGQAIAADSVGVAVFLLRHEQTGLLRRIVERLSRIVVLVAESTGFQIHF